MRDLTEEELKLAPKWANRYFIKGDNDVYFISSSHFRAVLIGCNNRPFSMSQDCIEMLHSTPIPIKKPFDITKHEFGDTVGFVETDGTELTLNSVVLNYVELYKDDAIAIAKALGVTGEDLK